MIYQSVKQNKVAALLLPLFLALTLICGCAYEAPAANAKDLYLDEVPAIAPDSLVLGAGVYIDYQLLAVCENSEEAYGALKSLASLAAASYGNGAGENEILNKIEIKKGYYDGELLVSQTELLSLLGVRGDVYSYAVHNAYGEELDLTISVATSSTEKVLSAVPYETVYSDAAFLEDDSQISVISGEDGLAEDTYKTVFVNGERCERILLDSETVKEPTDAKVLRGVSKRLANLMGYPSLSLPYDGRVSSYFGWRYLWGSSDNHNGIDFIAHSGGCYGDTVYASADGIVTEAEYHGGYGLRVVINHGNGFCTIYAHLSKTLVSVGDIVIRGEEIAEIGNSGKVTGAHLHFGVEIDGTVVDPGDYLNWD